MATLSLRIRNDLKRKAQVLARRQGVSLNNYLNAVLAASIAQEETLSFFDDRLKDIDLEELHQRVMAFMSESAPGEEPTIEELQRIMGDRY
jgi:antitoxin component of RelBE/YafQ-DinJ toxin-antitoxin module